MVSIEVPLSLHSAAPPREEYVQLHASEKAKCDGRKC